jgi:transcriptional accessory protein Tex/SPT6
MQESSVMSADVIETTTEETTAETVAAPSEPLSFADLKPKMQLTGTVKRLELYGAFIDLGPGLTGLIHVSKLGGEQVNRVSDVLKEGDQVSVWVEKVDPERQQVMLTMVPPLAVDWTELQTDRPYSGTVTRLENFGAFVNIGAEREGLVHISELSHDYVKHPSEVVKVGDEVEVKVLGFNRRKRRIDLSMKALIEKPTVESAPAPARSEGGGRRGGGQGRDGGGDRRRREREHVEEYEPFDDDTEEVPTAMEIAMRRALGNETITAVKSEQRGGRKKGKQQREDQRRMQEDLLQRTLSMQGEN